MDVPSISVIVPTYNRAHTIARAVESALAGAPADAEVIVVDDASDDATAGVVRAIPDARVVYERLGAKANGNVARNRGAALARGALLAFLDSDDSFKPERIGRLLRLFGEHPELDAVADGFRVINRGRTIAAGVPAIVPPRDVLERLLVLHTVPLTCSAIAVRKSAFDDIGGFDAGLGRQQDRDLLLRLAMHHRVALGTGADVDKYQERDSLSRRAVGYVASLEALVARHAAFRAPGNEDILAYLSVRMILRSFFAGRVDIAAREVAALARSESLPGPARAIARYRSGKRERTRLAREIALASRGVQSY
jgi:glycosyltransferase involved in cell wall biosynthesis